MLNASYYLYSKKDEMSNILSKLRDIYTSRYNNIITILNTAKMEVLQKNFQQAQIIDYAPLQQYYYDICDKDEKDYIKSLMSIMKLKTSYDGIIFNDIFPNYHGKKKKKKGGKDDKEKHDELFASNENLQERYFQGLKFQIIANMEEIESLDIRNIDNFTTLCKFILLKMNVFVNDNRFLVDHSKVMFTNNPNEWTRYWPITKVISYFPYQKLYDMIFKDNDYTVRNYKNIPLTMTKNYKYTKKMERFSKEEILDIIQQSNSNRIKDIANGYNISHPDKLPLSEELLRYYIKKHELTSLVSMRVRKTKEKKENDNDNSHTKI